MNCWPDSRSIDSRVYRAADLKAQEEPSRLPPSAVRIGRLFDFGLTIAVDQAWQVPGISSSDGSFYVRHLKRISPRMVWLVAATGSVVILVTPYAMTPEAIINIRRSKPLVAVPI